MNPINPVGSNVLPEDFDGIFRFTNFTDTEFKARWNSVEYTFPALKTTPMIIAGATPEEVQSIRKKFAKELAIQVFYGTSKFEGMQSQGKNGGTPPLYTESDLAPFIQRCLEPLPVGSAKAKALPKDDGSRLRKDDEGNPVSRVLKTGESLIKEGTPIA